MNEASSVPGRSPIFIGGTGRSGTTLLANVLDSHPEVWTVPTESRLLIDPGGLVDLVDALSIRYSPPTAHVAFVKFIEFALVDLITPRETPYRNHNLAAFIGEAHYRRTIEGFVESLKLGEYETKVDFWTETALMTHLRNVARLGSGFSRDRVPSSPREFVERLSRRLARARDARSSSAAPAPPSSSALPAPPSSLATPSPGPSAPRSHLAPSWHRPYPVRGLRRQIIRYYDRAEIVEAAAQMIDTLFSQPMSRAGKNLWCEKTPLNILFLPVLAEFFPDATFIHIKRDPRGVAWSLCHQRFGPPTLEASTVWLREMCRAWLSLTFRPRNYFEIKLEDLATDTADTLGPILTACGLDPSWEGLPDIDLAKVNHWQTEMSGHDRRQVEKLLGDIISRMGYDDAVDPIAAQAQLTA